MLGVLSGSLLVVLVDQGQMVLHQIVDQKAVAVVLAVLPSPQSA